MPGKKLGAKGFVQGYWDLNYSELDTMDGIANAKDHVSYLQSLFACEYIDISSIIDFGFGLGYLFKESLNCFLPYKALGIEPSPYAFNKVKRDRTFAPVSSMKLKLLKCDLETWCKTEADKHRSFDLGICTSVFQYLSEEEIDYVLPIMAQKVKYLYFSVPTDKELKRQVEELSFEDVYAQRRSKSFYFKKIKKHFTFISMRLLESKVHYDEDTTSFTDLLFRF
ncbi:MAG: class I SAM-dependent methyltransferase [Bacteriovoracaceae bacterium]|nr:class I SAM-dependent methyltransferase [Bacteriovoracaceae bacterium]